MKAAMHPQQASGSAASEHELRRIMQALLWEWSDDVAVAPRGRFVDFDAVSSSALGLQHAQRFRLFPNSVSSADIEQLGAEAAADDLSPVVVAPAGLEVGVHPLPGMRMIDADVFADLCEQSGLLVRGATGHLRVDRAAVSELRDRNDARLSMLNGLMWLRPLSRNRVPPPLRWTGTPAHELFERCFFVTMTTSFRARGVSWGTRKRGQPLPDGLLQLPSVAEPALYDCKASHGGYSMSHRDLTGFADYLNHIPQAVRTWPPTVIPRFLVISAQIHGGLRDASFAGRQLSFAAIIEPGRRHIH